ncbi:MAG: hypothetical protein AAFP82_11285 [Bacteroidota bacterium]
MPAKTQYLSSNWVRFSKIMAAIFGAYAAAVLGHTALASAVPNDTPVLLTSTFSLFWVWCGLMVMVFLIKRAWVSWAVLLSVILVSSLVIFL